MRTAITAAILFLASATLFAQADDEQVQRRHKATAPAPGEVQYVDDAGRPATQNEVAYDLKSGEPMSLTFRGVRLEVLEVGNDGIKLRVAAGE